MKANSDTGHASAYSVLEVQDQVSQKQKSNYCTVEGSMRKDDTVLPYSVPAGHPNHAGRVRKGALSRSFDFPFYSRQCEYRAVPFMRPRNILDGCRYPFPKI